MNIIENGSSLLGFPTAYRMFRTLFVGAAAREIYVRQYVKPRAGEKVLDLGCGPADVLDCLPSLNYTGLDMNPGYIESAKKRFANKGRFWCKDVNVAALGAERGTFDLVLATGLLHHLDDQQAGTMFGLALDALNPTGRMVTFDGCYVSGQSAITRWMLGNDRGRFVRTESEYRRLASTRFRNVESHLRHDLLRVPYTHSVSCAARIEARTSRALHSSVLLPCRRKHKKTMPRGPATSWKSENWRAFRKTTLRWCSLPSFS